jgi:hypothetical protein
VRQLNFIKGIQGTIVEHRWRCNLTTLGIERRRQDKIIRRRTTARIQGMQRVLRAAETGSEGEEGVGGEDRGRKGFILYRILTHAHTQKKRAAVTSLGHRR